MRGFTLAIASFKGGVGKTTLTLNLGCALARREWRTLVIDADPQGAIGLSLHRDLSAANGLAEALESGDLEDALVPTRIPTLSLLPVGDLAPAAGADSIRAAALRRLLDRAGSAFDLVLIDLPSGLAGVSDVVLRNVDGALLVLQAEPLALRTLEPLLRALGQLRRPAPIELLGIVLTMVQSRNPTSLGTVQEAWSLIPNLVYEGFVPRDPVFLDASAAGLPVSLMSRRPPPVAAVFDRLAAELEERLPNDSREPIDESFIPLLD